MRLQHGPLACIIITLTVWAGLPLATHAAWEPTKPVEFNVPAGTGGGADIMARFLSPLIQKNKLAAQPFVVVNRSGGAGAEGFLHVKEKKGDQHMIIITLSNLFTTGKLSRSWSTAWRPCCWRWSWET